MIFKLFPRHFIYYIMRHRVLFKLFNFSGQSPYLCSAHRSLPTFFVVISEILGFSNLFLCYFGLLGVSGPDSCYLRGWKGFPQAGSRISLGGGWEGLRPIVKENISPGYLLSV